MLQIRRATDGSYVLIDGRPLPVSDEAVGVGGMLGVLVIVALISAAVAGAVIYFTMMQSRPFMDDRGTTPWSDGPDVEHDDRPADTPDEMVDPWALYRKEGRSWTMRSTVGGAESLLKYEVIRSDADGAVLRMTMLDRNGAAMAPPTETPFGFGDVMPPMEDGVESRVETITVEGGTFRCHVIEAAGRTSWNAIDYPGLIVKMEAPNMTIELIEFID